MNKPLKLSELQLCRGVGVGESRLGVTLPECVPERDILANDVCSLPHPCAVRHERIRMITRCIAIQHEFSLLASICKTFRKDDENIEGDIPVTKEVSSASGKHCHM
jgi:hypothetical protein